MFWYTSNSIFFFGRVKPGLAQNSINGMIGYNIIYKKKSHILGSFPIWPNIHIFKASPINVKFNMLLNIPQ